jgi:hypothetical protein
LDDNFRNRIQNFYFIFWEGESIIITLKMFTQNAGSIIEREKAGEMEQRSVLLGEKFG